MKKKRDQEALENDIKMTAMDVDETHTASQQSSADLPIEFQPAQQQPNPIQGNIRTGADAFWPSDNLNDGLFATGPADMMAQSSWLDGPTDEVIDWAQWDVWLGNVDPLRPNGGATAPGQGFG